LPHTKRTLLRARTRGEKRIRNYYQKKVAVKGEKAKKKNIKSGIR